MTHNIWIDAGSSDRRLFRNMLGSFMTGVTVVATRDHSGMARAFTANSFTSVSLDPALVLVCLAKSASSCEAFTAAADFSINILGDWQRSHSNAFAAAGPAKDEALARLTPEKVPVVEDSLATLLCDHHQVIDAGDHVIVLGKVRSFRTKAGQPLGYFRGGYVGFGLAARQLEQLGVPLTVGGLLEWRDKVVLCRRQGARCWEIPNAPLYSAEHHNQLLSALFARLGIEAQASFLYSIFQEQGDRHTTMVFLVETNTPVIAHDLEDGTQIDCFGIEDSPWELVQGEMSKGMLLRFFHERAAEQFGIYCDTVDGGRVAILGGKPQPWSEWKAERSVASSPGDIQIS